MRVSLVFDAGFCPSRSGLMLVMQECFPVFSSIRNLESSIGCFKSVPQSKTHFPGYIQAFFTVSTPHCPFIETKMSIGGQFSWFSFGLSISLNAPL
jgi:hypothetical protein